MPIQQSIPGLTFHLTVELEMRRKHLALQWLLVGVVSYKVALYNVPGQGAWKVAHIFQESWSLTVTKFIHPIGTKILSGNGQ